MPLVWIDLEMTGEILTNNLVVKICVFYLLTDSVSRILLESLNPQHYFLYETFKYSASHTFVFRPTPILRDAYNIDSEFGLTTKPILRMLIRVGSLEALRSPS